MSFTCSQKSSILTHTLFNRYKGLIKVKQLRSHLFQLQELSKQLKSNADKQLCDQTIRQVDTQMNQLINKLKNDNNITANDVDRDVKQLNQSINENVSLLRSKLAEQERLMKIQQQMEIERKQREEEERKAREIEDMKRQKAEMEERNRFEAIARAEIEAKLMKEEEERRRTEQTLLEAEMKRLDQERRDYELATRLAQESQSTVSDDWQSSPTMLPRSAAVIYNLIFDFKKLTFICRR